MFLEGTRLNHCVPRANAVMVSGDRCPIVVYVSLLRGSLEGTCWSGSLLEMLVHQVLELE